MRKIIVTVLFATILLSCNTRQYEVETEFKKQLNTIIDEVDIPGINLAILMPNDEIIAVSAGYSDKENQILMKPEDKMFSGSTGKTFCAAIILQLVDEGKLDVDDSISKYFGKEEWFNKLPNANDVTNRMLLNHTSGIPRYVFDDTIWKTMQNDPEKVWSGVERLEFIFDAEPTHPAGKGWGYSDTNYIILGMLIEQTTGNEYYAELTKRILQPMNLTNTLPANKREIPGLITGYSVHSKDLFVPEKVLLENGKFVFNPQMEFTGGGIACTTSDLAKWGKIYYNGELFSEESYKMMRTPCDQKTSLDDNAGYGFATFVWNENDQISYGHTGFFPGYVTIVEYIPALDISIAMQWNTDKKNPEKSLHQYLNDVKAILF
ncbi:MAG: beta-lactamase family protein [Bacteroidales bacterium]|nr:beta-lactamase family protein [Bacteroidales bacterium]